MQQITFIIPEVASFISGGNLYNQRLLAALQGVSSVAITCLSLEEVSDDLGEGVFFVDSLYLEQLAERINVRKAGQVFYLIVHHLSSMYSESRLDDAVDLAAQEERLLQEYEGFLVTSDYTAAYLKAKQLLQPIIVLPPISNRPKTISSIRTATPIRAIIVANLIPRKGILPFLKILANCSSSFANPFTIEIIGETSLDRDYATACQQLISKNSWLGERVQLKGALPPSEVQQAYQEANLLISVAAFETFGMALQEGVVFGLPILVVKGGNSANHVKEGVNGFIFDTIEVLVDKLIFLSKSSVDMEQLLLRAFYHRKKLPTSTWQQHGTKLLKDLGIA